MAIADDIKALGEEIEASYGVRVAAVEDLVKETRRTLKDFQRDHKEMAKALKADLAKVKPRLTQTESQRLEDFKAINAGIKARIDGIVKETARLLSDFSKEQKETAAALKEALAKGESERLGDFRRMLGEIQRRQEERVAGVQATLREFRKDQEETHKHWRDLAKVMAAKRAGKRAPEPKVAERVTEKAEEVKEEVPPEKPMTYREFLKAHRSEVAHLSGKEQMKELARMWREYKRTSS